MREYLETFFRRKWLFFVPFLLVLIIAIVGGVYLSWTYQVQARLWVKQNTILDQSGADLSMPQASTTDEFSQLTALLQTDEFLGRVVDSVPALKAKSDTPENRDAQITSLRSKLTSWVTENKLITFQYTNRDPQTAQQVVSNTMTLFMAQRLEDRTSSADSAITFLQSEQTTYQSQLADASNALAAWENAHPPATRATLEQSQQLEYQRLQNTYDTTYDHLKYIGSELEKAQFSRSKALATQSSTYEVTDPPVVPTSPDLSLNKLLSLALIGLLVAAGLGFTFVALATWFGGRRVVAAGGTALPDWLDRMMTREEQTA